MLRAQDLDRLIARLPRLGFRSYAVLDADEYAKFVERFGNTATVRRGYVGRLYVTRHGVGIYQIGP
jgi:hypothetical protein